MSMREVIYSYHDLMNMLDSLLREPNKFWDEFYVDREKDVPFFENHPDENLVSYFDRELIESGKVLELGCGPGRNAIYLAKKDCYVDAVDLSEEALKWAKERAGNENVPIHFIKENIFNLNVEEQKYDFIYDSGCFHHVAPHRRLDYIKLLKRALKPNGRFGITCFIENGELGGSDISDWDVYKTGSLHGGLGYTEEKLKAIFHNFSAIEIREMKNTRNSNSTFGVTGLLTALFQKNNNDW